MNVYLHCVRLSPPSVIHFPASLHPERLSLHQVPVLRRWTHSAALGQLHQNSKGQSHAFLSNDLASSLATIWKQKRTFGHVAKEVCVLCLSAVWDGPVRELPGCCEESLQFASSALGSAQRWVYTYLLYYGRSSRIAHILHTVVFVSTPCFACLNISGRTEWNENFHTIFLWLYFQTEATAMLKTVPMSHRLILYLLPLPPNTHKFETHLVSFLINNLKVPCYTHFRMFIFWNKFSYF